MFGWTGKILVVNLTKRKSRIWKYEKELAYKFIGGRGFAIKILWDWLKPGTDPLSPGNILVIAAGPLTGLPTPSSGKLIIASKSPLTYGYGDGCIGTLASVKMRYAGYDAIVITGRSSKPIYTYIDNERIEFLPADDLWGTDTFSAERKLRERHGRTSGILLIGPAGENLVRYATIVSQEGRSGGRPGMGAVMGSKNLKAIVINGSKIPPVFDLNSLKKTAADAYRSIEEKPGYQFWRRQGTMAAVLWSQENSVLPTQNFNEGVFDDFSGISGEFMEKIKINQRGCPLCNAYCGNVIEDIEGKAVEVDYENVAMLGSNLLIGDLRKIGVLNRLADMWGIDTISLGNVIGFAIEVKEKGLVNGHDVEWGSYKKIRELAEDIVYKRGIGKTLSLGVAAAAESIGSPSEKFAVHVKGLEVTGYDCHAAPGMALSYGTSPIGAHHKDAWVIAWETQHDRLSYSREKVLKVIELQRIRGGLFEVLISCRLPWVELGLELDWYPKLFRAATGIDISLEHLTSEIGDRIYALIRLFWVREKGRWSRYMDYPPKKWFITSLTKGPLKGAKLDIDHYDHMLSIYYEERGWDERGIPRKSILEKLGLSSEAQEIGSIISLSS